MTDPIDNQTAPSFQPIASRFRAEVGYGDTTNLQPSSLLPGDTIKYSPEAKKLGPVAPVDIKAAIAPETRAVSAEPIRPSFGMKNPNASPARIPSGNNRAASIIAPRGNAKR